MVKRIVLALAFVAALGAGGLSLTNTAEAHGCYHGGRGWYGGGGRGYYSSYYRGYYPRSAYYGRPYRAYYPGAYYGGYPYGYPGGAYISIGF